jgi:hypothetical protein
MKGMRVRVGGDQTIQHLYGSDSRRTHAETVVQTSSQRETERERKRERERERQRERGGRDRPAIRDRKRAKH